MKRFVVFLMVLFCLSSVGSVSALGTSAKAAALICGDTGEVLYSKNADERLPMASTTKIMTALLLCEAGQPEKTFTVTEEMVRVEGSSMGLLPGDTVSRRDLLYGMLLASGNDAANVTAYHLAGSLPQFAEMMNQKALSLGLQNTHFVTPSGLDDENHYTTARELALLAREALKNEQFVTASSSQKATLCYGNPPYNRTLTNHNKLLKSYEGLIGVKTGFTKRSGRCLVTAAKRDGKYVIAVTLSDPNDWADHQALLDFGLSVVQPVESPKELFSSTVQVVGGTKTSVKTSASMNSFSCYDNEKIEYRYQMPRFLYAPIDKDQPVGTVECYYDDVLVDSACIYAAEEVSSSSLSFSEKYVKTIKGILEKF